MVKQEIKTIPSKDKFGNLLYPGRYVFTWFLISPGCWKLLSIHPQ